MASGLPVVAPNSGGVLSYATNENAWLAEPDAASFAEVILDIFSSPATTEQKTRNALDTASRYSWQASTDSIFALYDRMHAEFTGRRDLYDYTKAVNRTDFVSRFATC
jgi:glycosyltransferase involved in cell wall biosynthesis